MFTVYSSNVKFHKIHRAPEKITRGIRLLLYTKVEFYASNKRNILDEIKC